MTETIYKAVQEYITNHKLTPEPDGHIELTNAQRQVIAFYAGIDVRNYSRVPRWVQVDE